MKRIAEFKGGRSNWTMKYTARNFLFCTLLSKIIF